MRDFRSRQALLQGENKSYALCCQQISARPTCGPETHQILHCTNNTRTACYALAQTTSVMPVPRAIRDTSTPLTQPVQSRCWLQTHLDVQMPHKNLSTVVFR